MKEYEVNLRMWQKGEDPVDAAKIYMETVQPPSSWFLNVRDLKTDESFTVDTSTWEIVRI